MSTGINQFMREQLVERRHKLEGAERRHQASDHLQLLLREVDSALSRIDEGSYGICESCHDSIETDRLIADPLVRFCLDHMSQHEKSALERDLDLARRVQQGLLPKANLSLHGWQICYHYEAAGVVSGDYCDVIDAGENGVYFMVGDVSGKGVAASMLMSHLHAMFRTLIPVGLPLPRMLQHASRVFCESTLPNQYATLVAGRAWPDGRIEICNAGHPLPFVVRDGGSEAVGAADLPLGLFENTEFELTELHLESGQGLVVYSDGVSELADSDGTEYGAERLRHVLSRDRTLNPSALLSSCRLDLSAFQRQAARTDDMTLFVLGRT